MSFNCVHLADVHFRGLKRHDEYRDVFQKFFVKCEELNPDAIFIGGDIVHSKTQGISPELIDVLHWWFKSMAEICPVHVILGNHDGLVLNHDRQDAITPIINAINSPNIHLYKNSGVYPIKEGFNWCVFSCFDEENWKSVKPVKGEISIATYHGGVLGSKTDTDWDISGEVSEQFFSDFDFAFLGDIHKFQYIDAEKRIAYPGSTIQQNYGEDLKKGFLYWEIKNKWDFKSTFHQLENPSPFITIDWKGDYETTISSLRNKPKNARFRVRSDVSLTQAEIRLIYTFLKEKKNAKEIVFKVDVKKDFIKNQKTKIKSLDLWDSNQRSQIIENYFNDSLDEEELEKIKELFSETIELIPEDSIKKPSTWSLKKLNFDNTFSYGKGNELDFEKMRGIVGIFAKNASGKSSIPGTIMYNLFNGSDRGSLKNLHVINSRKGNCSSSALVEVDNKEYLINRKTIKRQAKNGSVAATTYLDLKRYIDGTQIDESEEQRRETEKILRDLVGTNEDFLMTSFASQGSINSFIKEKGASRKSILTKFIGLDVFEELYKCSRENFNLIKGRLSSQKQQDWEKEIDNHTNEITNLESLKEALKKKELDLKEKESKIQYQITKNQSSVSDIDINSLENMCLKLDHEKKTLENKKESLENDNLILTSKINKIETALEKIDINFLKQEKQRLDESSLKLNSLMMELDNQKKELKDSNDSLKILESVPCTQPCVKIPANEAGVDLSSCKFVSRAHEKSANQTNLNKNIKILETSVKDLINLTKTLKDFNIDKKISLFNTNSNLLEKSKIELMSNENKVNFLNEKLDDISEKYLKEKARFEKALKLINASEQDKINALKEDLAKIQKDILDTSTKWSSCIGKITYLENSILDLEKERERFEELNETYKIHDIFSSSMSRKGIPVTLIKEMLPVINNEIKSILSNVVPFTVELEIEDGSNSMEIYINYGDSKRIIECGSGMEKMISSIAIRVALINISSLPKSDMLIIDEGFGALDENNLEACSRLLQSLKKWFKTILIISHVDAIKDIVDDTIEILSKEKDAYVKY